MIYVAKTKALISCGVTAHLVCPFVFAIAKKWFSHDAVHILPYAKGAWSCIEHFGAVSSSDNAPSGKPP